MNSLRLGCEKMSDYYTSCPYEKEFKEYSSENAYLEKGIMKIFHENFLTFHLRQRKSQTNIFQSSSYANKNFCAYYQKNDSCYVIPWQIVKSRDE